MPKRKIRLFIMILLFSSVLIFFIPHLINECYQCESGYITIWSAADVLSFYGAVLGSATTAASLAFTIIFTRKQIQREGFLKNENDKWSKIEIVFIRALDDINPMRPLMETMRNGLTNPSGIVNELQRYQVSSKIATDQLNAYLNITDYPKVESLVQGINAAIEQFDQIVQEQVEAYSKLISLLSVDNAKKTLATEASCPGSFPANTLSFCQKILNDTKDFCEEDIVKVTEKLSKKMIMAYQGIYRNLLQLKGSTFEQIHTEIQAKADAILSFRGEK